MKLIKRLDTFILKNFLTLFAGTFCISIFVVMMQFLWKYINDLVGKGLTFDVYAKFFFYAAETLVPTALPLAILLASLISFGNIGERLELLAIKAAGISLIRTMRPLIILISMFSLISFHFQNKIAPDAWQNLLQLLRSMKEKSPELDIPEGVFYDGIDNINLYVESKNKETGMLYDIVIYNLQDGASRAHIILADSGRLETTSDKMHLLLHLYQGGQFENMQGRDALLTGGVPYRRESFVEKHFIIDFDSNFNLTDQENESGNARTKGMKQLTHDIDSMENFYQKLSIAYYENMKRFSLDIPHETRISDYDSMTIAHMEDSTRQRLEKVEKAYLAQKAKTGIVIPKSSVNIDSLYNQSDSQQKQRIVMSALQRVGFQEQNTNGTAMTMGDGDKTIRLHWIQFWQKITMSLSCLLFFFVGAPLGAIIRKGGLGFPVVMAVIIFIIYYIIDTGAMKVGREGGIPVWFGMWMSTLVMAPLGIFLTVKSNNDSAVFNMDAYANLWKKLLGIRPKRNIVRKEVIINDPDYADMYKTLEQLIATSREYLGTLPRSTPLGYLRYIVRFWFSKREDMQAEGVNLLTEYVVDVLSNSKDRHVLRLLNGYPVMETRNFRFYRRRRKDLRAIIKYSEQIKDYIYGNILSVQ
ncbi:MAG: LptF/LptG family permease [Bacteroidaceae bacterium]|nr:LptF/LptG family permease [Bacteroidaceae bacterium]